MRSLILLGLVLSIFASCSKKEDAVPSNEWISKHGTKNSLNYGVFDLSDDYFLLTSAEQKELEKYLQFERDLEANQIGTVDNSERIAAEEDKIKTSEDRKAELEAKLESLDETSDAELYKSIEGIVDALKEGIELSKELIAELKMGEEKSKKSLNGQLEARQALIAQKRREAGSALLKKDLETLLINLAKAHAEKSLTNEQLASTIYDYFTLRYQIDHKVSLDPKTVEKRWNFIRTTGMSLKGNFSKRSYEKAVLDFGNFNKIVYNKDKSNIHDLLNENRLQCFSGTVFYALMALLSDYKVEEGLLVFTNGHIEPGYIHEDVLYTIEATAGGEAIERRGKVNEVQGEFTAMDLRQGLIYHMLEPMLANKDVAMNSILDYTDEVIAVDRLQMHQYDWDAIKQSKIDFIKTVNSSLFAFGRSSAAPGDQERSEFDNSEEGFETEIQPEFIYQNISNEKEKEREKEQKKYLNRTDIENNYLEINKISTTGYDTSSLPLLDEKYPDEVFIVNFAEGLFELDVLFDDLPDEITNESEEKRKEDYEVREMNFSRDLAKATMEVLNRSNVMGNILHARTYNRIFELSETCVNYGDRNGSVCLSMSDTSKPAESLFFNGRFQVSNDDNKYFRFRVEVVPKEKVMKK